MPDSVSADFGSWLKSQALFVSATPDNAAAWAATGTTSEVISPIASGADAQVEAARQAEFLKGPRARDAIVVPGLRRDLMCRAITVRGDRLGYENGAVVFVIGYSENRSSRTTTLNVIKRL